MLAVLSHLPPQPQTIKTKSQKVIKRRKEIRYHLIISYSCENNQHPKRTFFISKFLFHFHKTELNTHINSLLSTTHTHSRIRNIAKVETIFYSILIPSCAIIHASRRARIPAINVEHDPLCRQKFKNGDVNRRIFAKTT